MFRVMHEDKNRIDDQKLFYFPGRIGCWLENGGDWEKLKTIYPVYIEVSPSGACNHRCIFCALDFMGYKRDFLSPETYRKFAGVAGSKGVRSIMFGGEGEPLLHPQLPAMIEDTKKQGIDVAVTTNGVFLAESFVKQSLANINWIKVSLDAGTCATHALIHKCSTQDFDTILDNVRNAVVWKKKRSLSCEIGVQMILLKENETEVLSLARKVKKIGVDYFVVKPYSQGLSSANRISTMYGDTAKLARQLESISVPGFRATMRAQAFEALGAVTPPYRTCNAVPFFWAYVATNGDVYSCSNFLGQREFRLGNIARQSFERIWESGNRQRNWRFMKTMSTSECRLTCRMNSVNQYLEQLKTPPRNHTFI